VTAVQRVAAAREYLEYARKVHVADFPYSPLTRMAAELRRQLGQVLDVIGDDAGAGRLAAIRAVLARFDWESDDRQYALEEIDRIAGDDASLPAPALTDVQLAVLGHALGDAIAWATNDDFCHVCEAAPAGVCPDHQAELDQRDAYIKLARELGIEVRP
jgi:hypothetical protein